MKRHSVLDRSPRARSRLAALLVSVAPIVLLLIGPAAYAASVSSQLRVCESTTTQQSRGARHRLNAAARAMEACNDVIGRPHDARVSQIHRALMARAALRVAQGDAAGAISDYQQVLAVEATDSAARYELGRLQSRTNESEAALANLEAAYQAAVAAHNPVLAADVRLAQGEVYRDRGAWNAAISAYNEIIDAEIGVERRARAKIGRGYAYAGQGDLEQAMSDYRAALRDDPSLIEAVLALADGYRFSSFPAGGQPDADAFSSAQARYEDVLTRTAGLANPEQKMLRARAFYGFGDLYLRYYLSQSGEGSNAGDARSYLRQAYEKLDQAVGLAPDFWRALQVRGRARAQTAAMQEGAIADYTRALELSAGNSDLYLERGDLYRARDDVERAMRDYDEATRDGGANAYLAYIRRATLYLNARDYLRARRSLDAALGIAQGGDPLPSYLDRPTAIADALLTRSRAIWGMIDDPGVNARQVALESLNDADLAAQTRPTIARYQTGRCLARAVGGGQWDIANNACLYGVQLAGLSSDAGERSAAKGGMGLLQLRWALSDTPTTGQERARLMSSVRWFGEALDADAAPKGRDDAERVALNYYGRGVALECLGDYGQATRQMNNALRLDRGVAARFESYRIRRCRA